jgi:hypothetical protein
VPVLVKVSYFPNWNATGAEGPYRIGPNMMVVVPTSNHVEMSFGRSGSDYITILLSLVGIGLCFLWRRKGDVVHASEEPAAWWWRGDVPGADGSLAGAHPHYDDRAQLADLDEALDDDLDDDLDDGIDDGIDDDRDDDVVDDLDVLDVDIGSDGFERPDPSGGRSEPTDSDR